MDVSKKIDIRKLPYASCLLNGIKKKLPVGAYVIFNI
jgi:hypothetical protein